MMVLGARGAMGYVLGRGAGAAGNGLLTGLVAYWGLDEASGNALDKHSGGLTLTQNNSPGADTGKVYSTARTFDGSNQYFRRVSESAIETGNIDYSLAAWVYLSSTTGARAVLAKAVADATNGYEFAIIYNSNFRLVCGNNSGLQVLQATNFGAATANTWNLVLAWQDTTANKIYIQVNNGTPNEATRTITPTAAATKPLNIGRLESGAFYLSGRIGPVAFWKDRTLSADDRAALYNGGAGLAYSSFS